MKKTISIAFAAFVLLSFASCQKENLVPENQAPALRTITATFENNGTKTTLDADGKTPLWKSGDVIRVFGTRTEGEQYDDITLTTAGKTITFTTDLTGTLYAVYPASATTMESCTDGNITFTIPTVQDGTFGSANICVAKGDDKDKLVFSNATAVLEFSQNVSTDVIRVAVDAANNIAGTLTAKFDENNKATVTATGLTSKSIFTEAASSAQDKYYIAIAPGATGDVNFKYYTALQEATDSKSSATLAKNTIYTLSIPDDEYENSYVEITADYDNDPNTAETTLKWAKVNIGAIEPENYGHYFAWGDIEGQAAATSGTGAFASAFNWANCPFNNGSSNYDETYFNGIKNTVCPDGVLAKNYDVANKVLGGTWRLPTKEEFDALCNLSTEWETNYNNSGVNGYLFTDENDHSIFLPAAGYGNGTGLFTAGVHGYYWSSSLDISLPSRANYLYFRDGRAGSDIDYRYFGRSVRALSE